MGIWKKIKPSLETAEHVHFAEFIINAIFDWRPWVSGLAVGAITWLWSAADHRSALDVWLHALFAAVMFSIIGVCLLAAWRSFMQPAVFARLPETIERAIPLRAHTEQSRTEPKPQPYYSKADIDEILAAMRRISILLNQTAVDARDSAQEILNQWAHIADKKGKAELVLEMDRSDAKVKAVVNEVWVIVRDYRLYHDEVGPILDAANFSGRYFEVTDKFKNAISMLPGESAYGAMLNLVMPHRDDFADQVRALQDWMTAASGRLETTTRHLRSMANSDRPSASNLATVDGNAAARLPAILTIKLCDGRLSILQQAHPSPVIRHSTR
jgi:hypothetical protein